MAYLGLAFFAVVAIACLQHLRWRWRTRHRKKTRGRYRGGAALGNALQTLQAFAQPRAEHVVAELLKEPTDEDDETGPKDPTAHLLRQAKRIQKGEKVDQLTTLLPR
ncbi:MAG TPA: hypothetical protein VN612_01125 [Acidobacteriaceae bacterium]|nr:hypothetical protein [Acidobacteriaceae bacterium]